MNGLLTEICSQNAKVVATTVLVAMESAPVREGLVAMLSTLEGFRIVAEANTDAAAIEAARAHHPHLALIDLDLSGSGGWWTIRQLEAEHLAGAVVVLGKRADPAVAELVGAQGYVQVGTPPRDVLSAVRAAMDARLRAAHAPRHSSTCCPTSTPWSANQP